MKLKASLLTVALTGLSSSIQAEDIQDRWSIEQKNRWSAFVSVDYSRNRYKSHTSLSARNLSGSAVVRYALDKDSRIQAIVSGYHTYDNAVNRGDYYNDFWLSYSRNNLWRPLDNVVMSGEARIALPVSKASKRRDLRTSIRGSLRFVVDLSDTVEGLYLSDYLRVKKNFHQFKTAGEQPLTQYQISNIVALDYYFAEKFSFSANIMVRKNWNYAGRGYSPSIIHSEQFGYQINNHIDVAAGITNSASYYNPEQGSNPLDDLSDFDKSTLYVTLNYIF
ncbi:MAG: hypothetical protein HRU25_18235 [Psychrobium sp.]|nr:hypothetical protein [Psychrobium sp.]